MTSKIQVNFRSRRYSEVLMITSYGFSQFLQNLCFWGQGIHCWHSYWATMFGWPQKSRSTSGLRGTLRYWWLCHKFLTFLHYLCFRGQGIHCWHFYWATMFGWPQKSRSTSGLRGTLRYWWLYLMDFTISSAFMFLRSRNPLLTFLLSYNVRVTSKIQINFRFERYSKVLMIASYGFSQFFQYLCFRSQKIHCWHFYWATTFGWPQKSRSTFGLRGTRRYWWLCLKDFYNFFIIYVFEVKESIAGIPTELRCIVDFENP